jgi:hypothetical protein
MTASAAVRVLIVDNDLNLIGEYRKILCANGPDTPDLDPPFDAFERDLIASAVGHRNFPPVEIVTFQAGDEAVLAAREAAGDGQPFLVAFVDSELKAGLSGLETAERIRAADARMLIVMMAGRSPLHPIDMVARVPPAERLFFIKKPFHPYEIQHIVIVARQRLRSESSERSDRSVHLGGSHASMLQAILDRLPGGALVFDRHDKLVAVNAKVGLLFPDIADIFVPGASYLDLRRQLNSGSPALWGAAGGGQVWQHRNARWTLVIESVASTGETYCLFYDVTDLKNGDAIRRRSAQAARLTQVFSGLCGTIDRLFTEHSLDEGIKPVMERLKTVAQQQNLTPHAVDLSRYLSRAMRRIRRGLPKGIGLVAVFDPGLWSVEVDPDGLARALAEITANACDAMPSGGRIIVDAVNVRVSPGSEVAALGLALGDYVRVTIQDTGTGMSPEIADKALLPFQSRGDGQHLGLGLPIVHAFAIATGGWLEIEGGAGSGAIVRLYLPTRAPDVRATASGVTMALNRDLPPGLRPGGSLAAADPGQTP